MTRPLLELLEKARAAEHDRVPYFKGGRLITLAEYEAALRAQRDEFRKRSDDSATNFARVMYEGCAADIDPDGVKS